MGLSIRNARAEELAQGVAAETGASVTEPIIQAKGSDSSDTDVEPVNY